MKTKRNYHILTHLTVRPSILETDSASRYDSRIRGVPNNVASELRTHVDQAQVCGMERIGDLVYYDNNSDDNDENDDDTFHNTIQAEAVIEEANADDDSAYGESINNGFIDPIGQQQQKQQVLCLNIME